MTACRRDTVMSSRKMSESGWRPTVVASRSSEKRLPAFGPLRTTTTPMPAGISASRAPSSSSSSMRSSTARVTVVSSSPLSSAAPQDEQKLAPASLSCPQRAQITLERLLLPGASVPGEEPLRLLLLDESTVGGRVEERVHLLRVGHLDHEDPPLAVRVLVEELGRRLQRRVGLGEGATHRRVDVGYGLRGLHLGDAARRADVLARLRQLHEHDVTERVLREVRDPDPGPAGVDRDPLVLVRIPQPLRELHSRMSTAEPAESAGRTPGRAGGRSGHSPLPPRRA